MDDDYRNWGFFFCTLKEGEGEGTIECAPSSKGWRCGRGRGQTHARSATTSWRCHRHLNKLVHKYSAVDPGIPQRG